MEQRRRLLAAAAALLVPLLLAGRARADWTATCTAGCVCKWADGKKVAECANAGLTTVPDGLSADIQVLDLRGNALGVLVAGAFSSVGLVNLQRVHLRNCSLTDVDKNAFLGLSILIEVDLSGNQLRRLNPDTFASNERLRFLSLSHNPLEKLEAHQFPALMHLRLLDLSHCGLQLVDKKAFMHLAVLETLRLSGNRFTSLRPDVLLPLNRLKSLELHDNPWLCDCRLVALRDYLSESNLNSSLTLCDQPDSLRGRPWSKLATEYLACRPVVDVLVPDVEGRLGFDSTFSCLVRGNPPPAVWWILQDKQVVNVSTVSPADQFFISQPEAEARLHEETELWSNLTLRRISEQDAGQYRCVALNKAGQAEANATLNTPLAPVIVIVEQETGLPFVVVVAVAAVAAVLLLSGLLLLTVCLCRRRRRRNNNDSGGKQRHRQAGSKANGSAKANGNGSLSTNDAKESDQEKSLLDIEMDSASHQLSCKADGYQPVSQTETDLHNQRLHGLHGSSTYIPGDRFDNRVPESIARHLLANGLTVRHVDAASQVHSDGSFYPDLLDIPYRGRGGGSPSTNSGASTVPESASGAGAGTVVLPLSAAHLVGHPSYNTPDYHRVSSNVHPPLQFTDSISSTASGAAGGVLVPVGSRPGYVTLPRRPRPRMPSWSGTPPVSSPVPPNEAHQQPLYDTIGPRITADGSSSSALSLNKIAGLTPAATMGSPNASIRSSASATLGRGHKISLPAYYVPIEEVDVPSSPGVQQRSAGGGSSTLPLSTPNIATSGYPADSQRRYEPILHYFNSPHRPADDCASSAMTTSTPNNTAPYTSPEVLSPIPAAIDLRMPGNRMSVSSVHSGLGMRKKMPPAVAPKPLSALVTSRPCSVASRRESYAEAALDTGDRVLPSPGAKIAPKPPPKPKKQQRLSIAGSEASRFDEEDSAPFEDEGEDGTEV